MTSSPKHYVLGFLFNTDGSWVKLIRKNRPEWQAGRFNGVGGKVEQEEEDAYGPAAPIMAMAREFEEEAGVAVENPYEWEHFATMHGKDWAVFVYRLFCDRYFNACESKTDETLGSFEYTSFLKLNQDTDCISNLHWLVPLAKNSRNIQLPVIVGYQH